MREVYQVRACQKVGLLESGFVREKVTAEAGP